MTSRNKLILILLILLGFAMFISITSSDDKPTKAKTDPTEPVQITDEEAAFLKETLGLTADTTDNTLRTLAIALKAQQAENKTLKAEIAQQSSINTSAVNDLQSKLTVGLGDLQSKFDKELTELKSRTNEIGVTPPTIPNQDQLYDELGLGDNRITPSLPPADASGIIWLNPLDARVDDKTKIVTTPGMSARLKAEQDKQARLLSQGDDALFDEPVVTPVFTLVRGSVLSDATAMTALIGRIPVNGQVTSPYPFSLIVGKENLMASGFTLPEVKGAIVTGTLTGDWNLSCVRGSVEAFDFIMENGSVISIPEAVSTLTTDFDGDDVKTAMQLGFLADPNGNPCLSGIKITNAPSYLTMMGVLDGVTAAANAAAAAQTTTSVDSSGSGASSVTGNSGKYALANAAAGSVSNVNTWIRERMSSSFDAIYAEPGTQVAVHLGRTLNIDVPAEARQVRYPQFPQEATYALD